MKREDINFLAQLANKSKLEKLSVKIEEQIGVKTLSAPTQQTLLVPIKDPVSGGSFYAGEVLVTSCLVEVGKVKGWSMVMDCDDRVSFNVAVLDACFENKIFKKEIEMLLKEAKKEAEKKAKKLNQKVNSTRVSFDLM